MAPTHAITDPAPTEPQWGIVHAGMLTLSAMCLLLVAGCAGKPPVIGLKPESPLAEGEARVDTLRPTFRWERFPRAQDLEELGPRAGERIAAVTYELRLWKVEKGFSGIFKIPKRSGWTGVDYHDYKYWWGHECRDSDPGELVYRQQGLVQPEHTLGTPLQPNSRYFWTVRARFTLDGKHRATEWSEHLYYSLEGLKSRKLVCSIPATFHLIRTP